MVCSRSVLHVVLLLHIIFRGAAADGCDPIPLVCQLECPAFLGCSPGSAKPECADMPAECATICPACLKVKALERLSGLQGALNGLLGGQDRGGMGGPSTEVVDCGQMPAACTTTCTSFAMAGCLMPSKASDPSCVGVPPECMVQCPVYASCAKDKLADMATAMGGMAGALLGGGGDVPVAGQEHAPDCDDIPYQCTTTCVPFYQCALNRKSDGCDKMPPTCMSCLGFIPCLRSAGPRASDAFSKLPASAQAALRGADLGPDSGDGGGMTAKSSQCSDSSTPLCWDGTTPKRHVHRASGFCGDGNLPICADGSPISKPSRGQSGNQMASRPGQLPNQNSAEAPPAPTREGGLLLFGLALLSVFMVVATAAYGTYRICLKKSTASSQPHPQPPQPPSAADLAQAPQGTGYYMPPGTEMGVHGDYILAEGQPVIDFEAL